MATATRSYLFQAEPRAVSALSSTSKRPKYRDPQSSLSNQNASPTIITSAVEKSNIMFDKRVIRGSTYAAQTQLLNSQPNSFISTTQSRITTGPSSSSSSNRPARSSSSSSSTRPSNYRKPSNTSSSSSSSSRHATIQVQTEDYLEELVDQIFENDSATQTETSLWDDSINSAPIIPLEIRKPMGVDAWTHIEEKELFDFDFSVEPILSAVVGKALDQAQIEVVEEEEIKNLTKQKEKFEKERNLILIETQRLEATSIRREEEKQRRIEQEKLRLQMEQKIKEKLAAATIAKHFLFSLHDTVMNNLSHTGHLYDPIQKQVENLFLPQLIQQTINKLDEMKDARFVVDGIIDGAIQNLVEQEKERKRKEEEKKAEEERIKAEEEEKRRKEEEEKKRKEEEEKRIEEEKERERREREERGEDEEGEERDEDDEDGTRERKYDDEDDDDV